MSIRLFLTKDSFRIRSLFEMKQNRKGIDWLKNTEDETIKTVASSFFLLKKDRLYEKFGII